MIIKTQCRSISDMMIKTQCKLIYDMIIRTQCRSISDMIIKTQCRSISDMIIRTQCRSISDMIIKTQCRPIYDIIINFPIVKGTKLVLNLAVAEYNNTLLIHLRKYNDVGPIRYGLCFNVKNWFQFLGYLDGHVPAEDLHGITVQQSGSGSLYVKHRNNEITMYFTPADVEKIRER